MPAQSYPSIGSAAYVNISLSQTITGAKTFLAGSATTVPVTVKAFAGQTSNLTEWQDNVGTAKGFISPSGNAVFSGFVQAGGTGSAAAYIGDTGGYNSYIKTISASQTGLIIRGSASQTGTLQEWQQSDGTVRAAVGSGGAIKNVDDSNYFGIAPIVTSLWTGTPTLGISPTLASRIGLAIRGVASQTGNLQEWQNDAGTALAYIRSNGTAVIDGASTSVSTVLFVRNAAPSRTVLEVRAAASQSGNIMEIQNSAGVPQAGFDGNGWPIFYAGVTGGSATGSYWGKVPVNIPGTGTRWLQLFN